MFSIALEMLSYQLEAKSKVASMTSRMDSVASSDVDFYCLLLILQPKAKKLINFVFNWR